MRCAAQSSVAAACRRKRDTHIMRNSSSSQHPKLSRSASLSFIVMEVNHGGPCAIFEARCVETCLATARAFFLSISSASPP